MRAASISKVPPFPSKEGNRGKLTIHGKVFHYTIKKQIDRPQSGVTGKQLCLHLIEFDDDKRREVRVGYYVYVIGKRGKMVGRWVWGRYAAFMPLEDFEKLFLQAKKDWFKAV